MAHTIATHEKRLLELNAKLDTKYRNVIQAVTEAAHKYPKKKAHKMQHWLTDGSPVESSKSRGVLTLNNNSPGPSLPLPPPGAAKRPIPLVEKGGCRIKELPLPKLAQMLKATGKDVSANVHITHGLCVRKRAFVLFKFNSNLNFQQTQVVATTMNPKNLIRMRRFTSNSGMYTFRTLANRTAKSTKMLARISFRALAKVHRPIVCVVYFKCITL